jgi:hypothetical protein
MTGGGGMRGGNIEQKVPLLLDVPQCHVISVQKKF